MFPAAPQTSSQQAGLAPIAANVLVVSEDEPGQWRVADRANDLVLGPFADEPAALGLALQRVCHCSRWEIHVLDQFGTLVSAFNSDEDARYVKAD